VDLTSHGPEEWVCLSSQDGDIDDTYLERVGLLGAVRMYHQGFATRA
jgi:hypothetical protein